MDLQQIVRAAVRAALVIVCLTSGSWLSKQSVSAQKIGPVTVNRKTQDQQTFRPGLRNSFSEYPLSAVEMNLVLTQLRHKTGFVSLRFDEAGFMTVDDRSQIIGGSQAARELLLAAIDGTKSIVLQSHNRSPKVVFGRVRQGSRYTSSQSDVKMDSELIEIDFIDFKKLRGHRKAIEAFDPGFVILHELCHAALNLHDPLEKADAAGDCETYVNRIRRELGIPERQQYAATVSMKHLSLSAPNAIVSKLIFAQIQPGDEPGERTKTKRFFTWWNSQEVGDNSLSSSRR